MASKIQERIDELKAKLQAREGIPAYAENVAAIKSEIAKLEAMLP